MTILERIEILKQQQRAALQIVDKCTGAIEVLEQMLQKEETENKEE